MVKSIEPVGIRRLRKLQKHMAGIMDTSHFNMETYLSHDREAHPAMIHDKGVSKLTRKDLNDCGTTACALGYAATLFSREGLRFSDEGAFAGVPVCEVDGNLVEGFNAAAHFFGICRGDAEELFSSGGSSYKSRNWWTPQIWADHCQRWLDRHHPKEPIVSKVLRHLS